MIRKRYQLVLIILIMLNVKFIALGQSCNSDTFKITQTIKKINDIKVVISQCKSTIESTKVPYCKVFIKIYKGANLINSLGFSSIEPVGGQYGLLVYSELLKNHLIISKYGDYDGRTIIINSKGQLFNTIGGICYIDHTSGLLFSSYDSDMGGFSVFDLNVDSEIFKIPEMEDIPKEFYIADKDNKCFMKTVSETEKESIWEIDLKMKKIKATNLDSNSIKLKKLNTLTDYKKVYIECK